MQLSKHIILLVLFSLTAGLVSAAEEGEENPLVADTFTKKKHVRYFSDYETVVTNYLEAGDLQFSAAGGYVISKAGIESTNASPTVYSLDSNGSKWLAGVSGKYGLSDQFSIGTQLTYVTGTTENSSTISGTPSSSTNKTSGIQDFKLRGQFALALSSFGYLADVQYNPSIGKASFNNMTDEGNAYHEQSTVGIENYLIFKSSTVKWGGIFGYQYAFLGEDEQISSTGTASTREISGGNSLTAGGFAEFEKFYHTNLGLSYQRQESKTTTTAAGVVTELPVLDYLSLMATMQFNISRKVSIVPQFQYVTLLNKDIDPLFNYSQVDLIGIAAEIRMLF